MDLQDLQCMVDDIDQNGRGLTDWEADFLDSMMKRIDDGYGPTAAELAKLREIQAARVPR